MAPLRHRVSTIQPTAATKQGLDAMCVPVMIYERKLAYYKRPSRRVNRAAEIRFLGSKIQQVFRVLNSFQAIVPHMVHHLYVVQWYVYQKQLPGAVIQAPQLVERFGRPDQGSQALHLSFHLRYWSPQSPILVMST